MTALPSQPFFASPGARVALARERFFEQGERPTGMVSESVIQSWSRCIAAHQPPQRPVVFEPVTRSRLHGVMERHHLLLQAARGDLQHLETALAGSGARVLLTDPLGVIVHATPTGPEEPLLRHVARVGVNLAEEQVGTNAPALVARSGQAVTVLGAEHYFECVQALHCAAAPIRDGQGRLVGVLDLTVEARPFAFDAAALVGVYATLIENRLLQAQARRHLVLQFQVSGGLLGSPLEALVGIDGQGRLAWRNGAAGKLLGLGNAGTGAGTPEPDAEALFGTPLAQLLARCGQAQAAPLRLPNGLTVWLRAHGPEATQAPAAAAEAPLAVTPEPAPEPMATLQQATGDVIARTLAECDGNVSRAARRLGVSRGLLYRRLRAAGAAG
jgi:transcriptional regulator of acetoin/glycerol metabolism